MLEILYKDKDVIVINKPSGIPSEPDPTGDLDAMTQLKLELCERGEDMTLYLVHRLDRVTGGLLVFARRRSSASELSSLFSEHRLTKQYLAVIDGECDEEESLSDLLFRDARSGKAFIVDRERAGVKRAKLSYRRLLRIECETGVKSLLLVTLETGRFHQIRAQLSHRGTPITGDGKYGSRDKSASSIALHAARLSLPLKKGTLVVSSLPNEEAYPWSLFEFKETKEELSL